MATKITNCKIQFFSGFYESIWNTPIEDELESMEAEGIDTADCDVDYKGYEEMVAKTITEWYEEQLRQRINKGIKVEFCTIDSPRCYNYSMDSIIVNVTLDDDAQADILTKVAEHWDYLEKKIREEHTSCSGFHSFTSNDLTEWIDSNYLFGEDYYQAAYLSCMLAYILEAEFKAEGWDDDIDLAAYYETEIEPYGYINVKEALAV